MFNKIIVNIIGTLRRVPLIRLQRYCLFLYFLFFYSKKREKMAFYFVMLFFIPNFAAVMMKLRRGLELLFLLY